MKILGEIIKIKYRNEENGYTVLQVKNCETVFTLIGNFGVINEGLFIDAEVKEVENEVYGLQYNVVSYNLDIACGDDSSIINFLISLKVKGVGEKTCERIVSYFGKDTIDIIKNDKNKLISVKGLNIERINLLNEKVIEKSLDIDLILKLAKYKLPNNMIKKIIDFYGEEADEKIRENPYDLALNIEGIGFETCDKVARLVGIDEKSDERIKAAIIHVLNQGVSDGNVFLTYAELYYGLKKLIKIEDNIDLLDIFNELMLKSLIKIVDANKMKNLDDESIFNNKDTSNNNVFAEAKTNNCENYHTGHLDNRHIRSAHNKDGIKGNKNNVINCDKKDNTKCLFSDYGNHIIEDGKNINNNYYHNKLVFLKTQYNIEKKLSELLYSRKSDIKIITGGPGTGKTYNINKYLKETESISLRVLLCAPTGRAAKRIEEVTGHKAKTIHRLLECQKIKDTGRVYFAKNEDNKLDCDVIIVDEMSMVDELILLSLIKAVPMGAKIILVGDIDQLPSVGAGQVLLDMINSGYFEVMRLTKIYRQDESSNIVKNAHAVNKNEKINFDKDFNDFKFVKMSTEDKINDAIKILVKDKIPKFFDIDYSDIQVLCPSKMYKCGVDNLNIILQNALNPDDIKKQEIKNELNERRDI